MSAPEEIKKELVDLLGAEQQLLDLARDNNDIISFGSRYQNWYSRAYKLVETLGHERLAEFSSYYRIDCKRKVVNVENYVIQDFIKGIGARRDHYDKPLWDTNNLTMVRVVNQMQIISSLSSRVDSVLQDVKGHLFAELQDSELSAAAQLKKINLRAAGALAGVVLERHLQRVSENHGLVIKKKNPSISDLNDPLKQADVYDVPTWRKIQLLADIRNVCSHQKDVQPTVEQVDELIAGVNSVVKSIF
jgi:hypothetical protein